MHGHADHHLVPVHAVLVVRIATDRRLSLGHDDARRVGHGRQRHDGHGSAWRMPLEVVLRAQSVHAAGLGAVLHDALAVRAMRHAVARAPVRLVAALDHAAAAAAVSAAQSAALAALGAVGHRAATSAAVQFAQAPRLGRVVAAVTLAALAATMRDAEASALIAQPAA